MNDDCSIVESVLHVADLYHRGVICPAETWRQIHGAFAGADPREALSNFTSSDRTRVVAIYRDRPESLQRLASSSKGSGYAAILNWCALSSNS